MNEESKTITFVFNTLYIIINFATGESSIVCNYFPHLCRPLSSQAPRGSQTTSCTRAHTISRTRTLFHKHAHTNTHNFTHTHTVSHTYTQGPGAFAPVPFSRAERGALHAACLRKHLLIKPLPLGARANCRCNAESLDKTNMYVHSSAFYNVLTVVNSK